jgi:integrase/recombinase XerD
MKVFEQWLDENDHGPVEDVDALTIEDFFLHLSNEGYAPETIRVRYDTLTLFYRALAGKFGVIDESPFVHLDRDEFDSIMQGTKKKRVTKDEVTYVTPEQIEELCDHAPNPALRNELLIRLSYQTGLRQSETVAIELDDIDRDERRIRINSQKTHENRDVFYHESLDFLMDQYIDGGYRSSSMYAKESPYLFVSSRAGRLEKTKPNKIIKKAAKNAGIQSVLWTDPQGRNRHKLTSHAVRHGFGVQAVKTGMNVREIQKTMGHKNLDMTMTYLDITSTDVRDAYRDNFTPNPVD